VDNAGVEVCRVEAPASQIVESSGRLFVLRKASGNTPDVPGNIEAVLLNTEGKEERVFSSDSSKTDQLVYAPAMNLLLLYGRDIGQGVTLTNKAGENLLAKPELLVRAFSFDTGKPAKGEMPSAVDSRDDMLVDGDSGIVWLVRRTSEDQSTVWVADGYDRKLARVHRFRLWAAVNGDVAALPDNDAGMQLCFLRKQEVCAVFRKRPQVGSKWQSILVSLDNKSGEVSTCDIPGTGEYYRLNVGQANDIVAITKDTSAALVAFTPTPKCVWSRFWRQHRAESIVSPPLFMDGGKLLVTARSISENTFVAAYSVASAKLVWRGIIRMRGVSMIKAIGDSEALVFGENGTAKIQLREPEKKKPDGVTHDDPMEW
jgi:hypothetical protein